MSSISARSFLVTFCLVLGLARAGAVDWPDGYIIHEDSVSPDGQYGIAVPESDDVEKQQPNPKVEEYYALNYLADVKNHKVLGKIRGSDYFEHQNHAGLKTVWAEDSSWCVAQYDSRFGFDMISILEPKASSFVQTDIGERIKKTLGGAIKLKGHEEEWGDAMPYYQIDGGKLLVRALSTTDPKELDLKHAHFALFYGTYDLRSKKWLSANARALDYGEYNGADSAFGNIDAEAASIAREEDKLESLDTSLNGVYGILRAILPAARFAEIKKEQIEWLKKRDAAGSIEEKNKLIQARIKTLQQLVW